jgi:hypothetical protein
MSVHPHVRTPSLHHTNSHTAPLRATPTAQLGKYLVQWTAASAVFSALDVFATLWYDANSRAGQISAILSFCSCVYVLGFRRSDLLSGMAQRQATRTRVTRRRMRSVRRATEEEDLIEISEAETVDAPVHMQSAVAPSESVAVV